MTHPHDFSLLNDLLDGRMGWSAAEELRRRLVEEPELGQAYDELVRLRAGLLALPRKDPPRDFLAGVRARAGLPPSDAGTDGAAGAGAAAQAAPAAPSGGGSEAPGNVIRLRRRYLPLAAAAGLLMGLGGFALWRMRDRLDTPRLAETAEGRASGGKPAASAKGAEANVAKELADGAESSESLLRKQPGAPSGAAGDEATGTAQPHFGAPGGAVVPGLRVPRDEPAPAMPAAPPLSGPRTPAGAPAAPDDAAQPAGPVPPSLEGGRPNGDADAPPAAGPVEAGERAGVGTEAAPAREEAGLPRGRRAIGGGGGADAGGSSGAGGLSGDKAKSDGAAGGYKLGARGSDLAWASAGADDVLVVHAAGLDEARADVALLLAAVRGGSPARGLLEDARRVSGDRTHGYRSGGEPPLGEARGAEAGGALHAAPPAPPLGTFVVEVTDAEWERLEMALPAPETVTPILDRTKDKAPVDAPGASRPPPAGTPPVVPPPSPTPPPPPQSDVPPPPSPTVMPGAAPVAPARPAADAESPKGVEPQGEPASDAAGKKREDEADGKAVGAERQGAPRRRVRIVVLSR